MTPPNHTMTVLAAIFIMHGALSFADADTPSQRFTFEPAETAPQWRHPFADGTIRAPAIAPPGTLGDAALLASRFDFDIEGVAHLPGDTMPQLGPLLDKDYDLALLSDAVLHDFSDSAFEALLANVTRGMGLVIARYGGSGSDQWDKIADALDNVEANLAETMNRDHVPEWQGGLTHVTAGALGSGRVVLFDYVGEAPASHFLLPPHNYPAEAREIYLEDYLAFLARAARWAAGRDPEIAITAVEYLGPEGIGDEMPPDLPPEYAQRLREAVAHPPARPYRLALSSDVRPRHVLQVRTRQPGAPPVQFEDIPLDKGESAAEIVLLLDVGANLVDFQVLDGKDRLVEWRTFVLEGPARPRFANLSASRQLLLPNDRVTLSLDVFGKLRSVPPHDEDPTRVIVRATDALGRVAGYAETIVAPEIGHAEIPVRLADLLTPQVTFDVFATAVNPLAGPGASGAYLTGGPPLSAHAAFSLPVHLPPDENAFFFATCGALSSEYNVRAALETLAGLGVGTLIGQLKPDALRYADGADLRVMHTLRPGAPGEEAFFTAAAPLAEADVSRFLIPCESLLSNLSPEGFQAFLQSQYPSLAALNAAWRAEFARWDAVVPVMSAQGDEMDSYAPWLDFRRYQDVAAAESMADMRNALRSMNSAARIGVTCEAASGCMPAVAEGDMAVVPFDALALDRLRTIAPDAAVIADIGGMPQGQGAAWRAVLEGARGVAGGWILDTGTPGQFAALKPDKEPKPETSAIAETVAEIRSGYATLLGAASRVPASIAILDSPENRYFSEAEQSLGAYDEALNNWAEILDDLGHDFDFINADALERDEGSRYMALVLPLAPILTDGQIESVRRFHEQGGCLLADILPGTRDAHGVARTPPPLQAIFQSAPGADSRALLLGEPLPQYPNREDLEDSRALLEDIGSALKTFGLAPLFDIKARGKAPFRASRFAFRYGKADVFAVLRKPDDPRRRRSIKLDFGDEGVVYDMLSPEYDTRRGKIRTLLEAERPALFARLPYEVLGFSIVAPERVEPGRRLEFTCRVRVRGALPGQHILSVSLLRPNGAELRHYRHTLACDAGQAGGYIPLALNEVPGTYTLLVRDVLSGTAGKHAVEVAGPLVQQATPATNEE